MSISLGGQIEEGAAEPPRRPKLWTCPTALFLKARDIMDHCLTGHDHGENVAQMDASIEDIRYALAAKCLGR